MSTLNITNEIDAGGKPFMSVDAGMETPAPPPPARFNDGLSADYMRLECLRLAAGDHRTEDVVATAARMYAFVSGAEPAG